MNEEDIADIIEKLSDITTGFNLKNLSEDTLEFANDLWIIRDAVNRLHYKFYEKTDKA